MKSRIEIEQVPVKPFPKLMVEKPEAGTGAVVLFTAPKVGTVVYAGYDDEEPPYETGEHGTSWIMDCFKDFEGTVILSN